MCRRKQRVEGAVSAVGGIFVTRSIVKLKPDARRIGVRPGITAFEMEQVGVLLQPRAAGGVRRGPGGNGVIAKLVVGFEAVIKAIEFAGDGFDANSGV